MISYDVLFVKLYYILKILEQAEKDQLIKGKIIPALVQKSAIPTENLITGKKDGAPIWSSMDLKQLEVGEYCVNTKGEKIKITSLEETNEYVNMYNLERLSNNKTWFANEILVKE